MNEGCGPPRPAPPRQSSPSWPAPTPSLERHNLPGSGCLWRLCTCYFLCQKVLPDPSMACSLQVTSSGKPRLASVCPPRPPALTPRWSQPSLPPALGYSCVFLCLLVSCPPAPQAVSSQGSHWAEPLWQHHTLQPTLPLCEGAGLGPGRCPKGGLGPADGLAEDAQELTILLSGFFR